MVDLDMQQGSRSILDLSIIIPLYRDTLKLKNSLESYFQSFKNSAIAYEVIVVDNNSPNVNEIFSIIHSYKSKIDLVFVMQPKLDHSFSLSSARNRGVMNSRGTYVFFTDSDCMIDKEFVLCLANILHVSTQESIAYTGERLFVKTPKDISIQKNLETLVQSLERVPSASNYGLVKDRRFPWIERLPHQEHPWNFVHGCFMLMKKSDYLKVGGSDTAYDGNWGYEEIDLIFRMVRGLETKVLYLERAKVFHQEFAEDLDKIAQNSARTSKSENPNYQRICLLIPGFDEFKRFQWDSLDVKVK